MKKTKRFLIEEAKCDVAQGGPFVSIVIGSVKFNDGKSSKWLNLAEIDGYPSFHVTEEDVFDKLIENDFDDEFQEKVDNSHIEEFDGIFVGGEYEEIFEDIFEKENKPAVSLIRYIIALVRADVKGTKKLIKTAIGKYVDELEIPVSDIEDDILYDKSFDEDEEV